MESIRKELKRIYPYGGYGVNTLPDNLIDSSVRKAVEKKQCVECGEGEAKFPNEICDECLELYNATDDDEYYENKEEEAN